MGVALNGSVGQFSSFRVIELSCCIGEDEPLNHHQEIVPVLLLSGKKVLLS